MPSKSKNLVIIFSLGGIHMALGTRYVIEVAGGLTIAGSSAVNGCLGVARFRDEPLPVLDLHGRLGLGAASGRVETAVIYRLKGVTVAFPLDTVEDIIEIGEGAGILFPQMMMKEKGVFTHVYKWKERVALALDIHTLYDGVYLERLIDTLKEQVP